MDGWMDGWMDDLHFTPFSTVFQSYQDNERFNSVNNILFKHTDTYRIYRNNLHKCI